MKTLEDIKAELRSGLELQNALTARWHESGPGPEVRGGSGAGFGVESGDPQDPRACIAIQHACNFQLWHVEDAARRRDVGPEVIADCKRRIDALNQERNDGMEKVDACLVRALTPLLPAPPPGAAPRYNTESLGMAVDRMSILSLKIWHMDEQAARPDADAAHRRGCADKASVLRGQRRDLERSILDLVDEFAAGAKRPRLYFQFKMYNDPALNPELYKNREPSDA
jgi:hypothetical protein